MQFRRTYLIPVIVISSLFAAYGAIKMLEQPFWGHLPLFLILGSWLSISVFLFWRFHSKGIDPLVFLLCTLSGLLLGKAFVYTSPFLFIGFIPLLYAVSKIERSPNRSLWKHFGYAFHAFMLWNIIATYWVANAALIPGLVAFILNSLFMCIPWLGAIWVGRKMKSMWLPAFICFWLIYEWGHHQWEISWPWLTLGNGFAFYSDWVQWYEFTGTFGGSLWILIMNALGLWIIISPQKRFKLGITSILVLGIPIFISFEILKSVQFSGKQVEVAVVQPNYEAHYEKFSIDPKLQMIQFEKLSREVINSNTKYLVWPETSFEYLEKGTFETDWRIMRMRDLCGMYGQMCLVTGLGTIKTFKEGEPLTDAARESKRGGFPKYYEIQNSATQICATNSDYPVYVKSKLVPGVETFPYRRWLPFLKPIVDQLGGSVHGLGKQKERDVFASGEFKVAPVICYESIYGAYIGEYVHKGAQAIFVMTNDGWWDNTPGYKQHLYFGALRAIEYRRPIARSANTGISCFIDAKGSILDATTYGKSAAIRRTLLFSDQETFYLRHGDYLISIAMITSIMILILVGMAIWRARFLKNQ